MEVVKAEFPDHELAASPTVGGVFRIPTEVKEEEGSERGHCDVRHRRHIRPHSAKGTL